MMFVNRVEIFGDAGGGGGQLVVVSAGTEPPLKIVVVEKIMALVGQQGEQLAFAVHDAHMGSEQLVGAVEIEIDVEFMHVDLAVRCVGDAVHADQGAHLVGQSGDRLHVMDQADDVRAMGKADQLGPVGQQGFQVLDFEIVAVHVHAPFANHHAARFERSPGAVVGLVILVGDDDLTAGGHERT